MEVHGVPLVVITGGKVVLEEGKLQVTQGAGRFVPTPANNSIIYDRVRQRERTRKPRPVPREPYAGDVIDLAAEMSRNMTVTETETEGTVDANMHFRGKTS